MTDYAKKKNDELAALCKERGLPHTGKKAELVKRLEDHDAKDSKPSETAGAQGQEDEIDWDEDNAPTEKTTNTTTAPAKSESKGSDPAAAGKTDGQEAATEKTEESKEVFTLGLQERTLDEEIAKRKKRAEKFGLDISQDETLKLLERAKRFGSNNVPGLLNQALPERAERQKKRGREGKDEKPDRKRSRQRPEGDKPQAKQENGKVDGFPKWMTDKDREAAEKRKAKFTSAD